MVRQVPSPFLRKYPQALDSNIKEKFKNTEAGERSPADHLVRPWVYPRLRARPALGQHCKERGSCGARRRGAASLGAAAPLLAAPGLDRPRAPAPRR